MAASNDLRGWVMSAVSGIACVLGSAVICVDVLLQRFTHGSSFQIVYHNGFLSASLSLSAGVILFTSLYSMLPTAREYLMKAGWSHARSAYTLIGLFLAGVIGIRLLSALIHRYLPSHVVDCAHTHERSLHDHPDPERGQVPHKHHESTERTPLLKKHSSNSTSAVVVARPARGGHSTVQAPRSSNPDPWPVRFTRRWKTVMGGVKPQCDENGPCYGVSQACGNECSKTLVPTTPVLTADHASGPVPDLPPPLHTTPDGSSSSSHTGLDEEPGSSLAEPDGPTKQLPLTSSPQHHHHVPQNAFLSIGLQTSVAIALHKLPEGFITYATNHASPTLGTTVFLALFIHNISEGFAMALPLYLALHSRGWAMFWSSLLGGISQPLGAALAAIWIWGAQRAGGHNPSEVSWAVYGCMFAVTAGVMTSVGLQLFTEGLVLTHQRGMAIGFAVGGMGLMGLSFALTAS
ncbi:hypothetical protein AOCH_007151 [Aspergillus ochraceoroseus]|uniref:ZIP metal ion transporter n=1 Tax=Aspergillus ochraceoroseus TaxID=138278 RepID=A0A0F8V8D8_9EURO|nr:hypothetical protein AOCH_007151 [Aspergillus ochraceoroseus]